MKMYVTFGQTHRHEINGKILDKDCIACVDKPDGAEARKWIMETFDMRFASMYPEKCFDEELLEYYPRGIIYL